MKSFEWSRSLPFTDAVPFENFSVLIKHSYRTTSRRYLTRMYRGAYHKQSSGSVRREESHVTESAAGLFFLMKGK